MKRHGFTLVELLVVMAIIAVLIGLLMPAIGMVRQISQRTSCSSRMHQIGLAMIMFEDANNGNFPQTSHAGAGESWIYTLAPYLEQMDVVRICPADPNGDVRLANKGTSFVINGEIAIPDLPGYVGNAKQVHAPSETITVMEGSDQRDATDVDEDHCHPSDWFSADNTTPDQIWDSLTQEIQPDRHMGDSANYLYADAHVATINLLPIQTRAYARDNFALPDNGGMKQQ